MSADKVAEAVSKCEKPGHMADEFRFAHPEKAPKKLRETDFSENEERRF